eukprot:GHVL01014521.1.p1 GENE.GHVL01014521.1~~GHVL01014521.1.p1  ORF type:complete len:341 (+),score=27.10 GHVL01014521.1:56-1078(+)
MWRNIFIFVLFALFSSGEDESGADKTKALLNLAKNAEMNLMRFSSSEYSEYVLKAPRPYHIFIYFTAEKSVCGDCWVLDQKLQQTARSFFMNSPKKPIFFASVDVSKYKNIAKLHGMTRVPLLVHTAQKSLQKQGDLVLFRDNDKYSMKKNTVTVENIIHWANGFTEATVSLYMTPSEQLTKLRNTLLIGVCLILLFLALWKAVLKYPVIMSFGAVILHWLATSGIFYSVSHGFAMSGTEKDGTLSYISRSARTQYAGEGFGCALLLTLGGVSLVILCLVSQKIKKRRWGDPFTAVFLIGFVYIVKYIFSIYQFKLGWYNPTFMPPPGYIRGPVRLDQTS